MQSEDERGRKECDEMNVYTCSCSTCARSFCNAIYFIFLSKKLMFRHINNDIMERVVYNIPEILSTTVMKRFTLHSVCATSSRTKHGFAGFLANQMQLQLEIKYTQMCCISWDSSEYMCIADSILISISYTYHISKLCEELQNIIANKIVKLHQ